MHTTERSGKTLLFYISFTALCALFFFLGNNFEPYALALLFAALSAHASPIGCCACFTAASAVALNGNVALVCAGEAAVLFAGFSACERISRESREAARKAAPIPFFTLFFALTLFVIFAPFSPYALPPVFAFLNDALMQKIAVAAIVYLLSAVFSVAAKAILFRLLKCRLRADEIIFSLLLFVLSGIGLCRAFTPDVYLGVAFFILLFYAAAVKDSSSAVAAFVLALPAAFSGVSLEKFFVFGVAITAFAPLGRLPAVFALILSYFFFGVCENVFETATTYLVPWVLCVLLPSLFFLLLPSAVISRAENKLVFYREKHLSRIAINRNRAAIGEQLFEISAVFREIESSFTALSSSDSKDGAKEFMCKCVTDGVCGRCPGYSECNKELNTRAQIEKLIEIGCIKGRVSLIDIPEKLAAACRDQSGLLFAANKQLAEYRKYIVEADNAAGGRELLSKQAQAISEILKGLALEQSAPFASQRDKEKAVALALQKAGIVCSETMLCKTFSGDDSPVLSLVTYGKADVKKIAAAASEVLKTPMMISERITLSNDKFCCILRKKPIFDAAFGVASEKKHGESASGDTHSVIRIDERRFMVALSDGMGSGEYAKKVSETAISLLESFYRAKMPSDLVLSTVNKLLSFSKEETFACVDVAVVDLDSGKADIVKIGSPMGFILSDNTLKIMESDSLPLGILEAMHPTASTCYLKDNDVLLFVSDGVTSAFSSSGELLDELKKIPCYNPQEIADKLLAEVLRRENGTAQDDITVVAVRLYKGAATQSAAG